MSKTIEEINAKIQKGTAVVVTAEEIIPMVQKHGPRKIAKEVDVVTTGTFSPMCSSGAFLNIKQPREKMKFGGGVVSLNDVPAYAGLAAADVYVGATALKEDDPRNSKNQPGRFDYGGAHVIEDLIAGRTVRLKAGAYGTDCYPETRRQQAVGLSDMTDAFMFNPRNCYQNYNVAVNLSDKPIYTYMGKLKPRIGNAYYCSAGQLSPLFNDPYYRTIGLGTRIFFCGAQGYVVWHGTQHNPSGLRHENGTPRSPAGNVALMGNMKEMNSEWVRAVSFTGYGVTLSVAVGVPIPMLDMDMARYVAVTDAELTAPIVDYSSFYPRGEGPASLGDVSYADLKSGQIEVQGKKVPTGSFSSYQLAQKVAEHLKGLIQKGEFLLTQPQALLPGAQGGMEVL